jgi:protein TonB
MQIYHPSTCLRARDHWSKYLLVSFSLHALLLGGGVIWITSYRPPELVLAQGVMSLELISPPRPEGASAASGDAAQPKKIENAVAQKLEAPKRVVTSQPASHSAPPAVASKPLPVMAKIPTENTQLEPSVKPVTAIQPAIPAVKEDVQAKPAVTSTADVRQRREHDAAQAGSVVPSASHPGSPDHAAPVVIANPSPPYPDLALREGAEGTVIVRVAIDTEGKVSHAKVMQSSGRDDFDHAAVETIEKRWRYRPAMSWGHPVEDAETVRVRFVLPDV